MSAWLRAAADRLLATAFRLRTRAWRLPRVVRVGRFGTWSTITLALAVTVTLLLLSLVSYTGVQLARFERTDARRTMFVFAAPQALTAGLKLKRGHLGGTLGRPRDAQGPG